MNKKLGLLLLPLVPLSAIGIVEVANHIITPTPEIAVRDAPAKPVYERQTFTKPHVAPAPPPVDDGPSAPVAA
jgi:hypothetical protein